MAASSGVHRGRWRSKGQPGRHEDREVEQTRRSRSGLGRDVEQHDVPAGWYGYWNVGSAAGIAMGQAAEADTEERWSRGRRRSSDRASASRSLIERASVSMSPDGSARAADTAGTARRRRRQTIDGGQPRRRRRVGWTAGRRRCTSSIVTRRRAPRPSASTADRENVRSSASDAEREDQSSRHVRPASSGATPAPSRSRREREDPAEDVGMVGQPVAAQRACSRRPT